MIFEAINNIPHRRRRRRRSITLRGDNGSSKIAWKLPLIS